VGGNRIHAVANVIDLVSPAFGRHNGGPLGGRCHSMGGPETNRRSSPGGARRHRKAGDHDAPEPGSGAGSPFVGVSPGARGGRFAKFLVKGAKPVCRLAWNQGTGPDPRRDHQTVFSRDLRLPIFFFPIQANHGSLDNCADLKSASGIKRAASEGDITYTRGWRLAPRLHGPPNAKYAPGSFDLYVPYHSLR